MRKSSVFLRIPNARRDIRTWPQIDADALPSEMRLDFLRKKKAISAFLSDASYSEIQKETGLCSGEVKRLLSKCIQPDGEGDICGERALVAYVHTRPYRRKKPVSRPEGAGRGYCSGALTQLFEEFPEIEDRLEQEVLKQLPAGLKIAEAKISISNLQDVFLLLCESVGRNETGQWPYNTKTKGRTSLATFVRQLATKRPYEFIRARFGKDSTTRLSVGRGDDRLLLPQLPYDIVGLDEFTFDAFTTITIPVPGGGEQDIAIERIHIVLVIERQSKAICSWHAFFTASAKASDIRHAMQNAISPWKPWKFSIPGLSYGVPDAGMPSGLISGLEYHPWVILVVDNALAHQDLGLLADMGLITGSMVNLGPVGAWYRRADVERRILDVLKSSAQRLPSTTGSNPLDPVKNDPTGTAVKLKIRWTDVRQLIEVVIAQQNALPSEGIGMLTPIELLRQQVMDPSKAFLRRPLPSPQQSPHCLTMVHEEVTVRGSQKDGRRPYINLDRARYTNPTLAQSWHLIGKKLRLRIDEDDFRQVEASVIGSGAVIGTLAVQGAWSYSPHTRAMRKAINQLKYLRILAIPPSADPIPIYLEYLSARARAEAKPKAGKHKVSKSGTKLAEIEQRTGLTASETAEEVVPYRPNELFDQPLPSDATNPLRPSLRDMLWQRNSKDVGGAT